MDGPNLSDFEPSWSQDGYGLSGDQNNPDFSDGTTWDIYAGTIDQQSGDSWSTKVTSRQNQAPEDFISGAACNPGEGSDTSKVYIRSTSWNGMKWVCGWTETTTCA